MINEIVIPKNWRIARLGQVFKTTSGGTPSRKNSHYYRGNIPWVKSGELESNIILDTEEKISEEALQKSSAKIFPKGTLLIALYGATIGKLAMLGIDAATNQAICGIFENKDHSTKYLYWFLFYKRSNLIEAGIGGAQPNISQTILKNIEFPFPSLYEQQAIVSKIEELFSELDKGVEELKTAQQQLKVYRQTVLKWAFEGKLTGEWRTNQPTLPTSKEVMEKIAEEKKQKTRDLGRKYKHASNVTAAELEGLSKLPEGWNWCRLDEVIWSAKDGPHYSPKYQEKGIPFISGGNIKAEGINFDKAKFISKELHEELSLRCKPEVNDILYTKGGTTGIARVNTYEFEFNVWVHVAVLKLVNSILPFYLQYVLNSNHCYRQSQKYTHGVGNQDLGLTRMILITIPVCSIEEQRQTVQEIESRLSVCDKIEETINSSLKQADALRQSILKKAFEGKLEVDR